MSDLNDFYAFKTTTSGNGSGGGSTPSSFMLEGVDFLMGMYKTPPEGSSSVYGYVPVDLDWFCTQFSYNSTTSKYQATLYIYIDSSLSSNKNTIYVFPKVIGLRSSGM